MYIRYWVTRPYHKISIFTTIFSKRNMLAFFHDGCDTSHRQHVARGGAPTRRNASLEAVRSAVASNMLRFSERCSCSQTCSCLKVIRIGAGATSPYPRIRIGIIKRRRAF